MGERGAQVTRRDGAAFWSWLLQRVTAMALFPLLFLHMWVNHYADPGTVIQVITVEANLRQVSFVIVDSILLLFGLFHGLNGVRNVLYDYLNSDKLRKLASYGLLGLGGLFFAYGLAVILIVVGRA